MCLARKQGLEPQTSVLETDVLPIKLLSYVAAVDGTAPPSFGSKPKVLLLY